MDAEMFRLLRFRLGVSQTALAKMLGVHPVTVNKWEHKGASLVVELAMRGLLCEQERRHRPAAAEQRPDGSRQEEGEAG